MPDPEKNLAVFHRLAALCQNFAYVKPDIDLVTNRAPGTFDNENGL